MTRYYNQVPAVIADTLRAAAEDTSNATFTAIAAPGASKAIVVHFIKINTLTADTITTQTTGAVYLDKDYLGATSGVVKQFREKGITLPTNVGLQFVKGTAGTNLTYFIQYQIIDV